MKMNYQNNLLNLFKFIAAVFICFIHYGFHGKFGIAVNSSARFAVPLFFIISGWYVYPVYNSRKKVCLKIMHIVQVAVLMEGIYFLRHARSYNLELLSRYLSWKSVLEWIVIGRYGITGMGWFVYSLLICYIILYFVNSKNRMIFYKISFILMVVHLILNNTIMREVESAIYVSNAWLMGIPFFYLGMWMRENEKRLKEIKLSILLPIIFLGTIESIFVGMNFELRDLYLGSIFVSISLMIVAQKFEKYSRGGIFAILSILGKHLSTYIYLIHLIVRDNLISTFEQYNIVLGWGLNQILFILLTIGFSILIEFAVERNNSLIVEFISTRQGGYNKEK